MDWAKRADSRPFSSLGMIDRVVYPNFEPLISLAAAAAVTERIRPMTTVVRAPLRNAGLLAQQAASLDALSGGRLTLGLGIEGREDDFRAAPPPAVPTADVAVSGSIRNVNRLRGPRLSVRRTGGVP